MLHVTLCVCSFFFLNSFLLRVIMLIPCVFFLSSASQRETVSCLSSCSDCPLHPVISITFWLSFWFSSLLHSGSASGWSRKNIYPWDVSYKWSITNIDHAQNKTVFWKSPRTHYIYVLLSDKGRVRLPWLKTHNPPWRTSRISGCSHNCPVHLFWLLTRCSHLHHHASCENQ